MPKLGMEEIRRRQLIEATIASIHEVGFAESSLSRIAGKAGVSTGIVHHYFRNKADLMEATLRQLGVSLRLSVIRRLEKARSPSERLLAVIDGNIGTDQFTPKGVSAWLAFWAMVPTNDRLARVQHIIISRLDANLVHALKLMGRKDGREMARAISALIDGLWLRAALSRSGPNSEAARRLVLDYLNAKLDQKLG
ncbi:TetR family transcriptional regulator [Dongia mobilis]|uniref:HTH-type transcriptional regulator BetI n=1 Tax=Dongia mobilis TaxID=578943 RepID=A0A4R6WDF3_9PROT|nr:transcriptional regulator BetI [Dongia mobilis]TDQ77687.1 TetR family transcriptional regulator [Dongia mobilis]